MFCPKMAYFLHNLTIFTNKITLNWQFFPDLRVGFVDMK